MPDTAEPPSSFNSFSSKTISSYGMSSLSQRKKEASSQDFLSSIDESPEFYDPYSDLNLFLSQKIKREIRDENGIKKWSLKIQEELIKKISPEFQTKFPQYRLGIAALKKVWEKMSYYSQQIQHQKEATTSDGKLNIPFFIKENLRQYFLQKTPSSLQPFHYAHQLAMKMSECIATIDGMRPKMDHLTKLIWNIQRHLIVGGHPERCKSPYDEYDKIDRLIVKTLLEISAKEPQISCEGLEKKANEALHALHELPSFASTETMIANVSALLADKQYFSSSFHTKFLSEQKNALLAFVQRHISLGIAASVKPPLVDLVRRIISLYTLASQLPKSIPKSLIKEAFQALEANSVERPPLPQAIYAFISSERLLIQGDGISRSSMEMAQKVFDAYCEAVLLPSLKGEECVLEMIIWKSLSEMEGFLEKLPYRIGLRIEEEIAYVLIDHPNENFSVIAQAAVDFFRKAKEIVLSKKWSEIERKIHLWVSQGDMLCRWIRLDGENALLKLMIEKFQSMKTPAHRVQHALFISEVAQQYLRQYPELTPYAGQLSNRIEILYKYSWYALFGKNEESSYDRFIKWHTTRFLNHMQPCSEESLLNQLEEIVKKSLPLIPFDSSHARRIITSMQEKVKSEENHWETQYLAHG